MQDIIRLVLSEARGMWRFRWIAIAVAWGLCVVGWLVVYVLPDIYEARAQVFVDADSRLVEVMGEVGVAPGVGATVFVVRSAMLGRPQLKNVAADTGLENRAKDEEEYDELITELQTTIKIDPGRAADARNLYTISFRDKDRRMAIAVVEALLDRFVSDVLKRNDQGSEQATEYLDDQLEYYGNAMTDVEQKLADFKKQNLGMLPGDRGGIFERLQEEMDLVKKLKLDLSIELDRREALRQQLQVEDPNLPEGSVISGNTTVTESPTENTIRQLETRKAELLLVYTDMHPDVVAVKEQLEQLYQQRKREFAAMAAEGNGIEGASNSNNPVYQSVQIELNKTSVAIAGYRSEIAQHESLIKDLNSQINTIPDVEAEFARLNRNYDQFRSLYNQLLVQKERERMGEAGEEREVVSFNIIEPPIAALEPVSPRRFLFMLIVLAAGLGGGAAVAYLLHISNPVFSDIRTLRKLSGRPVLGAISMIRSERARHNHMVGLAAFATICTLLIVTFVLAVVLKDAGVAMMQSILAPSA